MIKKNKLSLFLLALVMMLSIYYINMPEGPSVSLPTTSDTVVTKHPELAALRLEILEQREQSVAEFENVLASSTSTASEKNTALLSMQEVLELTENEILAETFIIDLGYVDCFVAYENDKVSIHILNYEHSTQNYKEVKLVTEDVFGSNLKVAITTLAE